MRFAISAVLVAALAAFAPAGEPGWTSLFNGKDLTGWDTWLGKKHALVDVETKDPKTGEKKRSTQMRPVGEPVGLNTDPAGVYTIVEVDGKPAVRISGEIWGAITTKQEFENYHFKVEFKWGTKRWPPRENTVRDSGLLYHCVGPHGAGGSFWMRSQECQIQEKDCGDYWSVAGAIVDVEAERQGDKGPLVYKKGAPKQTVKSGRIVKHPDNEKPTGQWNTIEVLCHGGTCVHVVNGKVNMVLTNSRHVVDGKEVPLTRGKLQLQSEAAEVYYRGMAYRPIDRIPDEYLR